VRVRGTAVAGAFGAALAFALACGDVPTLPGGVAYITPIQLPSPSVAFGDTLRDSLGHAAPLRVIAISRDSTVITGLLVHYVLTSVNSGASVDNAGFLRAPDSLATLRLVAQVTDGTASGTLQLQTPEVSIDVVPLADSMARSGTLPDTALSLPLLQALQVTVFGRGSSARGPVGGIRVYYHVAAVYPGTVPAKGHVYLSDDQGGVLRADSTAIDTTSSSGIASRNLVGVVATDGTTPDSVAVEASASSQKGQALTGSPVRFIVRFRKPAQ